MKRWTATYNSICSRRLVHFVMMIFLVACGQPAVAPVGSSPPATTPPAATTTAASQATTKPTAAGPTILKSGMEAPDFTVTLLSGESFTLSEQRGKVVLLNFWATWCGPCVNEMPDIQRISDDFKEYVVVIGVDVGETKVQVDEFIKKKGFSYLIGLNEDASLIRDTYVTAGIPYTLVIDAKGVITQIFTGSGPDMYKKFTEAIQKAKG